MGSWGREDSQQGSGGGGRLWNGAGQAAVGRPQKVVAGRPCGPTFAHRQTGRNSGGAKQTLKPRALVQENKALNL